MQPVARLVIQHPLLFILNLLQMQEHLTIIFVTEKVSPLVVIQLRKVEQVHLLTDGAEVLLRYRIQLLARYLQLLTLLQLLTPTVAQQQQLRTLL